MNGLVDKIKKDAAYKKLLKTVKKELKKKGKATVLSIQKSSLEFNDKKNLDLFYAAQHVDYEYHANKHSGVWYISFLFHDSYDFDDFRTITKYGLKISFDNAANDLGFCMQKIGMMVPYDWNVRFVIKVKESSL